MFWTQFTLLHFTFLIKYVAYAYIFFIILSQFVVPSLAYLPSIRNPALAKSSIAKNSSLLPSHREQRCCFKAPSSSVERKRILSLICKVLRLSILRALIGWLEKLRNASRHWESSHFFEAEIMFSRGGNGANVASPSWLGADPQFNWKLIWKLARFSLRCLKTILLFSRSSMVFGGFSWCCWRPTKTTDSLSSFFCKLAFLTFLAALLCLARPQTCKDGEIGLETLFRFTKMQGSQGILYAWTLDQGVCCLRALACLGCHLPMHNTFSTMKGKLTFLLYQDDWKVPFFASERGAGRNVISLQKKCEGVYTLLSSLLHLIMHCRFHMIVFTGNNYLISNNDLYSMDRVGIPFWHVIAKEDDLVPCPAIFQALSHYLRILGPCAISSQRYHPPWRLGRQHTPQSDMEYLSLGALGITASFILRNPGWALENI